MEIVFMKSVALPAQDLCRELDWVVSNDRNY
jgi:hypothetical protein